MLQQVLADILDGDDPGEGQRQQVVEGAPHEQAASSGQISRRVEQAMAGQADRDLGDVAHERVAEQVDTKGAALLAVHGQQGPGRRQAWSAPAGRRSAPDR